MLMVDIFDTNRQTYIAGMVQIHIVPREGEILFVNRERYKVVRVEHTVQTEQRSHSIEIWVE